ncbi:hypothetical protein DFH09DRAFT_1086094 [Mycena vulgaris]|nr:hypothetical protein DFH09DRAFT_1086094 [Mycena vulgaris]
MHSPDLEFDFNLRTSVTSSFHKVCSDLSPSSSRSRPETREFRCPHETIRARCIIPDTGIIPKDGTRIVQPLFQRKCEANNAECSAVPNLYVARTGAKEKPAPPPSTNLASTKDTAQQRGYSRVGEAASLSAADEAPVGPRLYPHPRCASDTQAHSKGPTGAGVMRMTPALAAACVTVSSSHERCQDTAFGRRAPAIGTSSDEGFTVKHGAGHTGAAPRRRRGAAQHRRPRAGACPQIERAGALPGTTSPGCSAPPGPLLRDVRARRPGVRNSGVREYTAGRGDQKQDIPTKRHPLTRAHRGRRTQIELQAKRSRGGRPRKREAPMRMVGVDAPGARGVRADSCKDKERGYKTECPVIRISLSTTTIKTVSPPASQRKNRLIQNLDSKKAAASSVANADYLRYPTTLTSDLQSTASHARTPLAFSPPLCARDARILLDVANDPNLTPILTASPPPSFAVLPRDDHLFAAAPNSSTILTGYLPRFFPVLLQGVLRQFFTRPPFDGSKKPKRPRVINPSTLRVPVSPADASSRPIM